MILLTATPHSGDEEAFFNLLGLLHPSFRELKDAAAGSRQPLREQLARHFVQRRRPDIEEWQDRQVFPERLTAEITYQLTGAWGGLFEEVLSYARAGRARRGAGRPAPAHELVGGAGPAALPSTRFAPVLDGASASGAADGELSTTSTQAGERVLDGLDDALSTDDIRTRRTDRRHRRLRKLIAAAEKLAGAANDRSWQSS
jgi:hypothetical protein